MVSFIIGCGVTFAISKIYLSKSNVDIGINHNIISLMLALIIVGLLNFIQFIFSFILKIIL